MYGSTRDWQTTSYNDCKMSRLPSYSRSSAGDAASLVKNPHNACAVKRRWLTAGESPARELGSLHPEAIGAAVEETKPSEPPV